MGQGTLTDDDGAPFRVECGGGSDLARISCSLRHDTAYKPHEVGYCRAESERAYVLRTIPSAGKGILSRAVGVWVSPSSLNLCRHEDKSTLNMEHV